MTDELRAAVSIAVSDYAAASGMELLDVNTMLLRAGWPRRAECDPLTLRRLLDHLRCEQETMHDRLLAKHIRSGGSRSLMATRVLARVTGTSSGVEKEAA